MKIDQLLPFVEKPSRYCGREHNVRIKNWQDSKLHIALAFPDLYEIGMSHQGLQILYHIINSRSDLLAERVYAPGRDMEELLKKNDLPIFSLESARPLADFDIIGFTLPFELCYSNILTILDLAGIPFRSKDRDSSFPLIIGGGPCAFHPEPIADFFDAFLLGDGEEVILQITEKVLAAGKNFQKNELLLDLSNIDGVYVPSFFEPQYDLKGNMLEIKVLQGSKKSVRRSVLADLDIIPDFKPLVPQTRIVHDRLSLEVARGCTRGCRFCQAGVIYRPVRERKPEDIFHMACQGIIDGGFDEMALLSLSTGDYSCLSPLLVKLMDNFAKKNVSISMPSMRVGTLTPEIMEQVKLVRKTGFTIAPEAGTDRLRRVINKGITEEDLLATVKTAFELGWKLIKLYFMFGLPTETNKDLEAIPELVKKAMGVSGKGGNKVNVSVGVFVPKPHTPFQWAEQLTIEEGFERISFLKKNLPRGAKLKWNDPKTSFLEGVLSRGDRRLSAVIETAWQLGARLDAWSDIFNLELWYKAAEKQNINLEGYLRKRSFDEILPWDHLDSGVEVQFLKDEFFKGTAEEYTPDCRLHGCQKCGLCDFKAIKPVVNKSDFNAEISGSAGVRATKNQKTYYYWIYYNRLDYSRFMGHLELLQVLFRALRRAELPVLFSEGFNPSPKISFSPAIGVGTESYAEYFIAELASPINEAEWLEKLNLQMPSGINITSIKLGGKKQPERFETTYRIKIPKELNQEKIDSFLASKEYFIKVLRKKKPKKLEIRAMVKKLSIGDDNSVIFTLRIEPGMAVVKPVELITELFDLSKDETLKADIVKLCTSAL